MKRFVLLFAFLTLPAFAHASLLLEPYVGFDHSSIDDGTRSESGFGYAVGGRIGYSNFLGLQLGLDLEKASSKLGGAYDNNLNTTQYSAFVGFKLPILFRVYAGYTFKSDADTKVDATGAKEKFSNGKGYFLGASFTGLPFLDLNLEYRKGTYDKSELDGVDLNHKADYGNYLVSVSLPLEF